MHGERVDESVNVLTFGSASKFYRVNGPSRDRKRRMTSYHTIHFQDGVSQVISQHIFRLPVFKVMRSRNFHSMNVPQIWYKDSFSVPDVHFNKKKSGVH